MTLGDEHITRAAVCEKFADGLARKIGDTRAGGVRMSGEHNPLPSETRWATTFIEDLLSALDAAGAVGDVTPPPDSKVPFWAEHAANIARIPGYSDAFVGQVLRSQLEIADFLGARGLVLPEPQESQA